MASLQLQRRHAAVNVNNIHIDKRAGSEVKRRNMTNSQELAELSGYRAIKRLRRLGFLMTGSM